MNYIYFFVFCAALCVIDFNLLRFLSLQVQRFEVFVEGSVRRYKLLFEIYLERFYMKIGYIPKKYYDMAAEIRKDLGMDDNEQV